MLSDTSRDQPQKNPGTFLEIPNQAPIFAALLQKSGGTARTTEHVRQVPPVCGFNTCDGEGRSFFWGRTLVPRAGHRKLAVETDALSQKDGEYGRLIRAKHALNLLLCLCLLMLVLTVHCHSSFLSSIACVSLSLLPPTPLTTQRHHPTTLSRRRRAPPHPWGR